MPATSQLSIPQEKVKKRSKLELLSEQEALDFAQLILDIYKAKKEQ